MVGSGSLPRLLSSEDTVIATPIPWLLPRGLRVPRLICLCFPICAVGEVDGERARALRSERADRALPHMAVTSGKLPHLTFWGSVSLSLKEE